MPKSLLRDLQQGDCAELMKDWATNSVDLVFADPPFNIGYNAYDSTDDKLEDDDYLTWSAKWVEQCLRVVKPGGSFWIAIGDEYVSEIDVLVKQQIRASKKRGWEKRSHVIWYYTFGVNCADNFARSHTHLLYYTHKNSAKRIFNKDDPNLRHASSRQLIYNDKRANPKGRLPDNTWIISPLDFEKAFSGAEDTWIASRIAGTFHERVDRGTHGEQRGVPQMPAIIMDRIITACAKKGDLVADPFSGNGTTGVAAVSHGCEFIGIDLSKTCVKISRSQIEKAIREGTNAWSSGPTNAAKKTTPKKKSPPPKKKRAAKR